MPDKPDKPDKLENPEYLEDPEKPERPARAEETMYIKGMSEPKAQLQLRGLVNQLKLDRLKSFGKITSTRLSITKQ